MKKIFVLIISLCCALHSVDKGVVSEIYFSPQDQVADQLISYIRNEQESIKVAIYCLMHAGIAKALYEAYEQGVDVEIIVDPFSIKSRSPVARLVEKGVPTYVWSPKPLYTESRRKPLMHDKFCVFGRHTVWTGSFNFTRDATVNHRENVVVLKGDDVVDAYLDEFTSIKLGGCMSYSAYIKRLESQKVAKGSKKR